jgi:hemerythrin superfamily protein
MDRGSLFLVARTGAGMPPPIHQEVSMAKDAVALIKADHRKVEQLFREFEEAGDRAYKTKQQLVEAKAKKDGKELVAEAVEEHHVVKILLGELATMSAEDEAFDAKVTVLMENVRHHVEEEEEEMLPQSEKILGSDELTRLGEEMAARKQQLGAG